jgi:hypothetical protein
VPAEVKHELFFNNLSGEGLARFLTVVAERAGQHLDLSKLAAAAQVARQSAARAVDLGSALELLRRVR